MDVIVKTTLVVEAGWLPEFTAHLSSMVNVKKHLGGIADEEQAGEVSLTSGEEAAEIGMVLHVTFVVPHLDGAVHGALVRHSAIGQRTHCLHSDSNSIERHAGDNTTSDCHTGSPESVNPGRSEEEVRVLLAPIVNVSHRGTKHTDTESVSDTTAHQNTFISGTHEAIHDSAIVASALFRVELIDLHTGEDKVDRVSNGTSEEATSKSSHDHVIGTSSTSRIIVQLVVEEKETPDSCGCVCHGLGNETIPARVELSVAAA